MSGNNGNTAHLAPYQWKPGDPSPNPSGRPRSLAGLIRKETDNGKELLEILLSCARGQSEDVAKWSERLKAIEMLLDRGGWPRVSVEMAEGAGKPIIDLSTLTPEEISAIEQFGFLVAAIHQRVTSREVPPEV